MQARSFYQQLLLVSIGTMVMLVLLHQFPEFQEYTGLSWVILLFFIGLSLGMFIIGHRVAQSADRNAFSRIVLGFIAGKMFLSVLLIVGYNEWAQPPNRHFIILFIIVYLVYTIFETHFMMKLAREPKPK